MLSRAAGSYPDRDQLRNKEIDAPARLERDRRLATKPSPGRLMQAADVRCRKLQRWHCRARVYLSRPGEALERRSSRALAPSETVCGRQAGFFKGTHLPSSKAHHKAQGSPCSPECSPRAPGTGRLKQVWSFLELMPAESLCSHPHTKICDSCEALPHTTSCDTAFSRGYPVMQRGAGTTRLRRWSCFA